RLALQYRHVEADLPFPQRVHVDLVFLCQHAATTQTYTLSLHDALPISPRPSACARSPGAWADPGTAPISSSSMVRRSPARFLVQDRKSTRLNSSHEWISYAVFCLKKKKK